MDAHFQTAVPGVFAVGDVIAGPMLAHKAEEEGIACVERLVTGYGHVDYDTIPSIVYTSPEVASVGRSEEDLRAAGIPHHRAGHPPPISAASAPAIALFDGNAVNHAAMSRHAGVIASSSASTRAASQR